MSTILITGANGSLGQSLVRDIIKKHPTNQYILTVRNASDEDPNTKALQKIISQFPSVSASIEALDLGSLSKVRTFAEGISKRVASKQIPSISAIVCNAFSWSLVDTKYSADKYELGFQVTHLAQFLLVLKLLGSMNRSTGRIVLVSSLMHDAKNKNSMNPLGAKFPENLEEVVKPTVNKPGEEMARGFQRYSNGKLASVMFMESLNKKLLQDPALHGITVTAVNPGDFPASRCFKNTPLSMRIMMTIGTVGLPVFRHLTTMTTTTAAAVAMTEMTVGAEEHGKRGYFEGKKPAISSEDSKDEVLREKVWKACEGWTNLKQEETVLNLQKGGY